MHGGNIELAVCRAPKSILIIHHPHHPRYPTSIILIIYHPHATGSIGRKVNMPKKEIDVLYSYLDIVKHEQKKQNIQGGVLDKI